VTVHRVASGEKLRKPGVCGNDESLGNTGGDQVGEKLRKPGVCRTMKA
jgi:hypothetical protein